MTADVIADGLDQLLHVAERAATQALLGQVSKPAFDQIEPGTGRGHEAQVKARVAVARQQAVRLSTLWRDPTDDAELVRRGSLVGMPGLGWVSP